MKKVLVIRFSSIGDIVLTSPVLRCLKNKGFTVHFLVKPKFYTVIEYCPYIDKIHVFQNRAICIPILRKEKFDYIVDLQNNLTSRLLCRWLNCPSATFPKLNIRKFLVVLFKTKSILPRQHIVDRYFEAVKKLSVEKDSKGLEFFIGSEKISDAVKKVSEPYVAIVVGGSYGTKKISLKVLRTICANVSDKKIILLGDEKDGIEVEVLTREFSHVENWCGRANLHESAYLIQKAEFVVTSDTGLMHIAAAFKKKIYSLWGNTIPEFGMYPYLPHPASRIIENNRLWCRPCSKLGYQKCPLGHFKCMNDLDVHIIE